MNDTKIRNDEEVMFDEDDTSVTYGEDVLEYNRKIENTSEWDWMNGKGMDIFKVMEEGNTETIWRSVVKHYERRWSRDIYDEIGDDTIRYVCFELYKVMIHCDLNVYKSNV